MFIKYKIFFFFLISNYFYLFPPSRYVINYFMYINLSLLI